MATVPLCYTGKPEQLEAQLHPGTITTTNPAEDHCKQQHRPNKTKPNAIHEKYI